MKADLLVTRDTRTSTVRWIIERRDNPQGLALSPAQFVRLRQLEVPKEASGEAYSDSEERTRAFRENLARLGLIENVQEQPSPLPPMPTDDDPIPWAHWAVRQYVEQRRWPDPATYRGKRMDAPSGCYVSLKRHGALRGCFGSAMPRLPRLIDDIAQNAMAAACWDYRFIPVSVSELGDLTISVDVVCENELVLWPMEWDVQQYGLQLLSEKRVVATILPALAEVRDAKEQFEMALAKAGLGEWRGLRVARLATVRYPEGTVLPVRLDRGAIRERPNSGVLEGQKRPIASGFGSALLA